VELIVRDSCGASQPRSINSRNSRNSKNSRKESP
jgi:hypothetical protein